MDGARMQHGSARSIRAAHTGQSHLEELALGFAEKTVCEPWKRLKTRLHASEKMWQGLKPILLLQAYCGTTEVVPCYKAGFDGLLAAAWEILLPRKFKCDCPGCALLPRPAIRRIGKLDLSA
jgi:hypothetical protein